MHALSAENKIGYGCNFFREENFNSQGSFSVFVYAIRQKNGKSRQFRFSASVPAFFTDSDFQFFFFCNP